MKSRLFSLLSPCATLLPVSSSRRTTSRYRRDFLGRLEILRVRLRFQLECLKQNRPIAETREQLLWALQELDKIQLHYERKLPWPGGALGWVVDGTWPAGSGVRDGLAALEKEYYARLNRDR